MRQKPEQFAIAADYIGSRLNPTASNPMGGLGTMLGQSSLANKEKKKIEGKNDMLMQLIKSLTSAGQPGGNKVSFSALPEGAGYKVDVSTNLAGDSLETPVQAPIDDDFDDFMKTLDAYRIE
jgi:hypothetical protein